MSRGSEHALNASELAELSFFKSVGAALAQVTLTLTLTPTLNG
jgi:hypothetical protein